MRQSFADGDREALAQAIHGMIGSAGMVGAIDLAERSSELEELVRSDAPGGECGDRLQELEQEWERAAAELREILAR